MRLFRSSIYIVAFALMIVNAGSALAEKPTKAEIGQRGKAATAFLEAPDGRSGTAFCVHASGLFVTNEHVVRGSEKDELKLVLDPTLPTEKIWKAQVIRVDKNEDLALLRAHEGQDLPRLPLGSIEGLTELAEVVAVGFPLGKALASNRKEYPAVSVNAGTITAFRRNGSDLQQIQVDVALTFGNSGGPVLNENGEVIGVVVSGIPGASGINQAIPVSRLENFLNAPDIEFTPPTLTAATNEQPVEFKARAIPVLADAPSPSLKLELKSGDDLARQFPMENRDGVWVATAAPTASSTEAKIRITANFDFGAVAGIVDNMVIKVNDQPIRLRTVKRINFKDKPQTILADGRTIEGEIVGLNAVPFRLGDKITEFDLTKASFVTIQASNPTIVTATIIASVGGKEVGRVETPIPVQRHEARADPSSVPIVTAPLTEDMVVKRLPDVFSEMVVGGGGRYLIFHFPKLHKLAIFDVNEARVIKYLDVADDKITFTAGLHSLVIGLPESNRLERWSLDTFQLEKSSVPPTNATIKKVVMGHASNGPVALNGEFLDLQTFKQIPVVRRTNAGWEGDGSILSSADGTVWTRWGDNCVSFVLEGGELIRYEEGKLGHVLAGPDGRTVFTQNGIVTRRLKRTTASDASYGYCVPAVRGNFFLSISSGPPHGKAGFTAYLLGVNQPIARLNKFDHGLHLDSIGRDTYQMWRHVLFVPDAKLIIVLPGSNDQLVLYRFDPEAALQKSGLDYLIVTSSPPSQAMAGSQFSYPLTVLGNSSNIRFNLDSGPKGMAISSEGVITWQIPPDADGKVDVILTVSDDKGQEIFHSFAVRVLK